MENKYFEILNKKSGMRKKNRVGHKNNKRIYWTNVKITFAVFIRSKYILNVFNRENLVCLGMENIDINCIFFKFNSYKQESNT